MAFLLSSRPNLSWMDISSPPFYYVALHSAELSRLGKHLLQNYLALRKACRKLTVYSSKVYLLTVHFYTPLPPQVSLSTIYFIKTKDVYVNFLYKNCQRYNFYLWLGSFSKEHWQPQLSLFSFFLNMFMSNIKDEKLPKNI